MPISSSSVSSSRPAWPTNGSPCWSSLAPGASPTNIRSASAWPEPKTTVVRVLASCGQRVQTRACSQTALSSSRRSEALDMEPNYRHPRRIRGPSPQSPGYDGSRAGISMRELDPKSPRTTPACTVVGAGRLGTVLAAALSDAPALRRGQAVPAAAEVVLLTVPDGRIAQGARTVPEGPLLGHCSGATGLEVFEGREGFSLHPLMSTPPGATPHVLRGAGAAIDGTSDRALATASALAGRLGMIATRVKAEDRVAYHAAGAIAANFLVALEACAERLAATAGITRAQLAPLVLATAQQWAELGPERALTGPIARGDEATTQRHRETVEERTPELLPLWDELAEVTRAVAGRRGWTA